MPRAAAGMRRVLREPEEERTIARRPTYEPGGLAVKLGRQVARVAEAPDTALVGDAGAVVPRVRPKREPIVPPGCRLRALGGGVAVHELTDESRPIARVLQPRGQDIVRVA